MMRSAGEGWVGRMPIGRPRSFLGGALVGCVLALVIPALAQAAVPAALADGRLPRTATVRIRCRGKGRGCRARPVSARPKRMARLIRTLTGRVYRTGDRIAVSVTARGYEPIHAQITIRFNKIPIVGLK